MHGGKAEGTGGAGRTALGSRAREAGQAALSGLSSRQRDRAERVRVSVGAMKVNGGPAGGRGAC